MRQLAIVVAVAAVFGCDNNRNVAVSNDNPLGTVGGQVVELDGDMPLGDATVSLQSAGGTFTAMTDANGIYTIPKVPAGGFWLTISSPGHQSAYLSGQLDGAVGNFPVANPIVTVATVALFKNDYAFSVRLVDQNGAAAAGVPCVARVQARIFIYGYGGNNTNAPSQSGTYAIKATSDMNGLVTFTGMASLQALAMIQVGYQGGQVFVDVPPVKVMGTEEYAFAGATFAHDPSRLSSYNPNTGANDPLLDATIVLAGPNTELRVMNSSIDFLRDKSGVGPFPFTQATGSVLPLDKPIAITFNQAIDAKTLRATVLDENGQSTGIALTPTVNTNVVALAPASAFAAGKRYNLALHADALTTPAGNNPFPTPTVRELNITAPFFTAGAAAVTVTPTLDKTTLTAAVLTLTFSEPVGLGKGATAAVPCVAWYEGGGVILHAADPMNPVYPGEYSTTNPMVCNMPRTVDYASYDVTAITPQELKNPANSEILATGFSTVWKIQTSVTASADNLGCKSTTPMGASCVRPGQNAGGMTHPCSAA